MTTKQIDIPVTNAGEGRPSELDEANLAAHALGALPVLSYAIDNVALAALQTQNNAPLCCSLCDSHIDDPTPSSGLFMWTRGNDDVRFEEPPLCPTCARSLGITMFADLVRSPEE